MEATEGLIWSAIRRIGVYTEEEECAQRCRIVLANAVSKYRLPRGSPFSFFWTVISNACRNHSEKHFAAYRKGGLLGRRCF